MANTAVSTIDADNEKLSQLLLGQDNETLSGDVASQANDELRTDVQDEKPKGNSSSKPDPSKAWGNLSAFEPLAGSNDPAKQAPAYQPAELTHPKEEEAAAAKEKAKLAAEKTAKANTAASEAEIKAVADSPWTQLSNALTQEYAQAETPVAAAVSGSEIPAAQGAAANSALASLGLSSGSSAGSWLSAQTEAAQATAAPVEQAMAQEGAQYSAEAAPIEKALQGYGEANALAVQTAPEATWLNALASHVQSNLSYYGLVPTADVGAGGSLSGGVATALKEAGGYGGTAGAGTTPIQDVTAASGGGTKVSAQAAQALAQGGTNGTASLPAPSANAAG